MEEEEGQLEEGRGPMCSCYSSAPPSDVFLSDAILPINFQREISCYFHNSFSLTVLFRANFVKRGANEKIGGTFSWEYH